MPNKYFQLYSLSLLEITQINPSLGLSIAKALGVSSNSTCSGFLLDMSELQIEDAGTFALVAQNRIPPGRETDLAAKRKLFERVIDRNMEKFRSRYSNQAIP